MPARDKIFIISKKRRKRIQRLLSEKSISSIMKDGLQVAAFFGLFCYQLFTWIIRRFEYFFAVIKTWGQQVLLWKQVRFVEQVASIYLPPSEEQLRLQKAERKIVETRLQKRPEKLKGVEKCVSRSKRWLTGRVMPYGQYTIRNWGAIPFVTFCASRTGIISEYWVGDIVN
ncbi:hypothetical protein COOONC_01334 [Cooperia oncophora]